MRRSFIRIRPRIRFSARPGTSLLGFTPGLPPSAEQCAWTRASLRILAEAYSGDVRPLWVVRFRRDLSCLQHAPQDLGELFLFLSYAQDA